MSATRSTPKPSAQPSAAMNASPAEIEADKKMKESGGMLGQDITLESHPNERKLLDQATFAANLLEHRSSYNLQTMSDQRRIELKSIIQNYKDILNNKEKTPVERAKAAGQLIKIAECKEFGGSGGNIRQFADAALKGMASGDPLLGLVLAILFFLLRKAVEAYRLNQAENNLKAYKEGLAKVGAKPDPDKEAALTLEVDKAEERVRNFDAAEAKLKAAFSVDSVPEVVSSSRPLTSAQNSAVDEFKAFVSSTQLWVLLGIAVFILGLALSLASFFSIRNTRCRVRTAPLCSAGHCGCGARGVVKACSFAGSCRCTTRAAIAGSRSAVSRGSISARSI
jgi:hypothetical protein